MTIQITDHYNAVEPSPLRSTINAVIRLLSRELSFGQVNISILLTDDAEIHRLNKTFRDKDKPTNVLSFPFQENILDGFSDIPAQELGDIVISVETAKKEALEYNHSLTHRINWLIIHGMLHLLGYDHEKSEKEAKIVHNLELQLLEKVYNQRNTIMTQLAINVDHVATVRQARGTVEPDPVTAAAICEIAGASGIVVHLREDRRHIQDRDVYLLRKTVKTKLNLEMGANKEIIALALDIEPDMITLVPEKRQELTTEGGLDVVSQKKKLEKVIKKFSKADIPVSIFVDPDERQITASHDIGARFVEIHTGRYCDALSEKERDQEFQLIAGAAEQAYQLGLQVNGGHGLDYATTSRIAALDVIDELSIGHAIISRSIFTGLDQAVRDMIKIIQSAQMQVI